jgi:signal transduction histidine kinase
MKPQAAGVSPENVKPFRLVRYFGATSITIMFLFALGLSSLMGGWSRKVLLESYEEYARLLATNLNHQVFRQFVLPTVTLYGQIELSSEFQQRRLDRVVRQTIHSLNIDQVNIYDVGGVLVYSTAKKELGQVVHTGPEFEAVAGGREMTALMAEPSLWDFTLHRRLTRPALLRTLTPFRADQLATSFTPGPVLGVFELVVDLTSELEQIFRLELLVSLVACGLMALMSGILILIVRQGERILNRRAEDSKRLEIQLQESERLAALGRMVASVSHEIKTPLGIIRSTGELLGSQVEEGPAQKLCGVIIEECSRLNRIVTEFLDFARPLSPNLRPCQVEEILERNLNALAPELERRGVKVERRFTAPAQTMADPDLLYRAFLNVLVNALQAMPQGGTLTVAIQPADSGGFRVEVADTGGGIAPEALERVFEPFFTLKEKGSGLGLSIVKSIVEAHRGGIEIKSRPGRGTRVNITI